MFKTKRNVILSAIMLATLSGCSSIPKTTDIKTVNRGDVSSSINQNEYWSQDPSIQTIYSNTGTQILKQSVIPADIKNKEISIKSMPSSNIEDFLTAISLELGIPTIIESEEVSSKLVYIPNYNGKLIHLLEMISSSKDISFEYKNGALIAKDSSSYVITLPQNEDLLTTVSSELESLGARNIQSSVTSGTIFYNTTLKNQEKIESYLDRVVNNSSLITLQVMVINVNTDRERKTGFDWSSFQAQLGDIGVVSNSSNSGNGSIDLGNGDGGNSDSNEGNGIFAKISGSSIGLNISRGDVNISGLFNLLSTYGNTKTNQDVSLKTISGKEVDLDSFQEIPYVSDVNLSTTTDGLSNSGIDTDTVKNGLTMSFLPYYEADSQLISVDVSIELETLLGFVELSGGNQLGTITQPRTQRQAFNNTIRVPVGETVILGGVTYESISDNRNSLSVLDNADTASQNTNISSNSLFIVIRPTVILYKNVTGKGE